MNQYKCGGCGNDTYTIYQADNAIITECIKCKSRSIISVQAKLDVDWYIDENNTTGDGCMCVGWGD
jgi:DNA-directed RNA polymerase subunit RPC12/RpoP